LAIWGQGLPGAVEAETPDLQIPSLMPQPHNDGEIPSLVSKFDWLWSSEIAEYDYLNMYIQKYGLF